MELIANRMNLGADNAGENQRVIEELEALQQQRLLATIQGMNQHRSLNMFGNPTLPVPSLSNSLLMDPLLASMNAQQVMLGPSSSSTLVDMSRLRAHLLGLHQPSSLSASSLPMGNFNSLNMLQPSAYHQHSLLSQHPLLSGGQQQREATLKAPASPSSFSNEKSKSAAGASGAEEGGLPQLVFAECDERHLSEYQCLLRQQIEFYESSRTEMKWNIQGRNKAIVEDQVGLRCKWCAHIPIHRRAPGAVYYSSSLDGLYQAAQNMAKNHFCKDCNHIPASVKKHLTKLRDTRRRAPGGKRYWAEGARALGIYECQGGLRYNKNKNTKTSSSSSSRMTPEPR